MKKMQLFSSDGKAGSPASPVSNMGADDIEKLTRLVTAEVMKYLKK